jgi:hypothetical protein
LAYEFERLGEVISKKIVDRTGYVLDSQARRFYLGELYREEAIVRAQKMKNLELLFREKNEVIKLEPLWGRGYEVIRKLQHLQNDIPQTGSSMVTLHEGHRICVALALP